MEDAEYMEPLFKDRFYSLRDSAQDKGLNNAQDLGDSGRLGP